MRKEIDLSVHSRTKDARGRTNGANRLQAIAHKPEPAQGEPDPPFPYLETIVVAAKKYPYAAIGIMISIASVVMAAVTVLAVAIIGGMFLMYGEMRGVAATQQTLLKQYQETRSEVKDTGNIMRAYENVNGKRTEVLINLMDPAQQARFREWERANPFPLMPVAPKEPNKEN